jgi:hypothetical protein
VKLATETHTQCFQEWRLKENSEKNLKKEGINYPRPTEQEAGLAQEPT